MNTAELKQFNATKRTRLIISILIDVIGLISYIVPIFGEAIDIIWGPISGMAILLMYKQNLTVGVLGALFGTAEEVLIFDFMPTATLLWIYTYKVKKDAISTEGK